MKLRKHLAVGAAVLTAGLLTLQTGTAHATTRGPVNHVKVGTTDPITTTAPLTGAIKAGVGTATYAGYTTTCSGGTVAGTVNPSPPGFTFSTLNIICDHPLGIDTNISLTPGCGALSAGATGTASSNPAPNDLRDGADAKGGKYAPITFTPITIPSKCITVTIDGGCTYRVDGTLTMQFVEPPKTVNGVQYQDLVIKADNTLVTRNASFLCFGLVPNGSAVTVDGITFNLRTTGTPWPGLIDFHNAH